MVPTCEKMAWCKNVFIVSYTFINKYLCQMKIWSTYLKASLQLRCSIYFIITNERLDEF